MQSGTRIIGVDPGLASCGYGILEVRGSTLKHLVHGVITTRAKETAGTRLIHIHDSLQRILNQYKPDLASVEALYFAKNTSSALPVAQSKGVVLFLLAKNNIHATEFPPQAIKQAVVGVGRADKAQVQEMVKFLLGLEEIPRPDHAADALAAAICLINHQMQVDLKT